MEMEKPPDGETRKLFCYSKNMRKAPGEERNFKKRTYILT